MLTLQDVERIKSYNEDALTTAIEDLRTVWKYRNKPISYWIPHPRLWVRRHVRRIRELRNELEDLRLQQP